MCRISTLLVVTLFASGVASTCLVASLWTIQGEGKVQCTASPIVQQAQNLHLVLRSPAVADGGQLPKEFTGDGAAATLPLEWSGVPNGTQCFAVIMHHIPPEGPIKWYWILYDIPADVTSLPKNVTGVGQIGNNSVNHKLEYAPPHSKGPGPKEYVYTIYALSARPKITVAPSEVNRDTLLAAMKDVILDRAELHVFYTRFIR